jgi:2C-methyl-D-erythritol 2,4-cyclodiphosphate synthase
MRSNIAAGLECNCDRINVKGKTNDGFGPEEQGDAISATVVIQVELEEDVD